ncbi:MAG: recombinase family protein [Phycisphaeraceae bacterium]
MGAAPSTPPSDNDASASPVRAVAYYRYAAENTTKDGLETQQDHVRMFAHRHDLHIIHEFTDRGKSGRSAEGRPAFTEMMHWVRTRQDFVLILVYDGSRWGRSQDADLAAHYESLCTEHGKRVIYTTVGFTRDEDKLIHRLRKSIRHYQIDEYRRALREKVRLGTAQAAQQGYHTGGSAPYGFHRMLLDANHKPERILQPGERKSVQNRRVVLVPGEKQQVEAVQQIFALFAEEGLSAGQIASRLSAQGIPSPRGGSWSHSSVRRILTNPHYAGRIVYNRTTGLLRRANPREQWITAPAAYPPIVPPERFTRVQNLLALHKGGERR